MQATRSHRGLSTARAALSVTWLLARTPDGVRADEVAHELGKSVSTAYNLLASLCDEGVAERLPGGLYHLSDAFRETVAEESDRHDLSGVVDDLLTRTHKRAYLAVLRSGHLRGAALDVFQREPLPTDSPLWDMPNVLVTPHSMSTASDENERLVDLFCANLRRYLDGGDLLNVVDKVRGY